MNIKIFLLILLLLALIINIFQCKERETFDVESTIIRHALEKRVDNLLGAAHLDTESHQDKLGTHQELMNTKIKLKKETVDFDTVKYSLTRDKVLITLYFDKLDEHSRNFYDDTMATYNNIDSFDSLEDVISLSDGNVKPWNMFKTIINTNKDEIPYLSKKLINVEEINCSSDKMDECHLKKGKLDRESGTHSLNGDTNPDQVISSNPPPRNKDLVDKLPKIIASFYKPINKEQSEHIVVEYEGIYSLFSEEKPTSLINIMMFLKDKIDEHLEIKEPDLEEKNINTMEERRMIYHLKHKHPDEYKVLNTNDTPIKNEYILLNEEKTIAQPLFVDKYLYKCPYCPQFVKSSSEIS